MHTSMRRRLAQAGAALALSTASLVTIGSAPASAGPCFPIKTISYYQGVIYAEGEFYCQSTGESTPIAIQIIRRNRDGTSTTLRSGMGSVSYRCQTTVTHTFVTNAPRMQSVTAPCF